MYRAYKTDIILAEHYHSVLRLPPCYPELNPIELILVTVKNWVADRNVTFRTEDMIKLADEKFTSFTKDDWELRCNHVTAIEAQYVTKLFTCYKNSELFSACLECWVRMADVFPLSSSCKPAYCSDVRCF